MKSTSWSAFLAVPF